MAAFMDRQEDRQALVRIVAVLLALAALAAAAGALPVRKRIVLLAVLRHAASVALAYAVKVHAPLDRRLWPAPGSGESEAVDLAEIFRALAVALAVPARAAIRAARWLCRLTLGLFGECSAAGSSSAPRHCLAEEPRFADTS